MPTRLEMLVKSNPMLLDVFNLWIDGIISDKPMLSALIDSGIENLAAIEVLDEAKEWKKSRRHIPNFVDIETPRNTIYGNEITMADWVIDEKGIGHWEEK